MIKMAQSDYLLVVKVLESNGDLIFSLLIEDDLEASGVIVNLKQGAHGLLGLRGHASNDDDLKVRAKLVR